MSSKVYMMNLRTKPKKNLFHKLDNLLNAAGLADTFKEKELVAVKLHFGEMGNTAFIRPVFLRRIVENIRKNGGNPFLTDANTLYAGTRSDAPSHISTGIKNGFAYSVVDAPLVIADGLRGKSETGVTVNQKRHKKVYIGKEIIEADSRIAVAHFQGPELSVFGGAIKNLGMGCASRRGKLAQHSGVAPKVTAKKCVGCGDCLGHCSQKAISLEEEKAKIDDKKCIGCGECILICLNSAIDINWAQSIPEFMENMVEYTMGVMKGKENKTLCVNFITDVSPACDCYPSNDQAIVRDVGILASKDPIAIDQASVDLVNKEDALPNCCLKKNLKAGEDKFKGMYPKVDWEIQMEYAEKLGLGNRKYELVEVK